VWIAKKKGQTAGQVEEEGEAQPGTEESAFTVEEPIALVFAIHPEFSEHKIRKYFELAHSLQKISDQSLKFVRSH
jgi:hypothetical protein